jgi:hypothetical protein
MNVPLNDIAARTTHGPIRAVRVRRWFAVVLLSLSACARIVPPGGGPEDREPPRIVARAPDSAATEVDLRQPLRLVFSEPMDRSTVRDWLLIAPWPGRMDCAWRKDTLECVPLDPWVDNTTYAVLLGVGATDRRRNALAAPVQFAFSTGPELADGRLDGIVRTHSLKPDGVTVYLFAWPEGTECPIRAESSLRPDPRSALRIAQTDKDGAFHLAFVPRRHPFLIGALFDRAGDRDYNEGADLWGFADCEVACPDTSAGPPGIEIYLVYADEPGDVSGTVVDSFCLGYVAPRRFRAQADSLRRILSGELDGSGFAPAPADSDSLPGLTAAEQESLRAAIARLAAQMSSAKADSARCAPPIWVAAFHEGADTAAAETRAAGPFELTDLSPGDYRLSAFRDLNGNGAYDAGEPAGRFPYAVGVRPGRKVTGAEWSIGSPDSGLTERDGASPSGRDRE